MSYHFQPMSLDHTRAIVQWRYPGEYAFYDLDADPEDLREFLEYEAREPHTKFAVTDDSGALVGYFEFKRQRCINGQDFQSPRPLCNPPTAICLNLSKWNVI